MSINPDKSDPVFLAWCAAWIDTEGSIGLYEVRRLRSNPLLAAYTIKVTVSQVDMEPLKLISAAFGGFIKRGARHSPRHRYVYNLVVQNRQACEMLSLVRPYLIVKVRQLELVLDAAELQATHKGKPQRSARNLYRIKLRLHKLNGWSDKRRAVLSATIRRNRPTPKRWSIKYDSCTVCHTTDHPHTSFGRCHKCWSAQYYQAHKEKWQQIAKLRES